MGDSIPLDSDWSNARSRNVVSIQPGGPGYPWKMIGIQHGLNNPSGGGRDVQRRWIAGPNGKDVYSQKEYTGDPKPYTGQMMVAITRETAQVMDDMEGIADDPCLPDVGGLMVRNDCANLDNPVNYLSHVMLVDTAVTSKDFSGALKKDPGTGGSGEDKIMRTLGVDAGELLESYKLRHTDNKAEGEAEAINCLTRYGAYLFAGNDIEGTPVSADVGYSSDKGKTWDWLAINTMTGAAENVDDITWFQNLVLVASDAVGVSYAEIDDVLAGTASSFTLCTLDGSAWATDFPNTIVRVKPNLVVCAGDGGFIAESTDGIAWTTAGASKVVTTENMLESAPATSDLFFLGGANAELVRYYQGTYSVITITGASGTETITALAVPPQRTNWLYVGLDTGEIYVCKDTTKATPVFEALTIGVFSGGSVDAIDFAGFRGAYMFIVHNTGGSGTVYRDISGGAGAGDIEQIDSPTNGGINDIIAWDHRTAVVVGEVVSTKGYIGRIIQ